MKSSLRLYCMKSGLNLHWSEIYAVILLDQCQSEKWNDVEAIVLIAISNWL